MSANTETLYVVEFSPVQRACQIETLHAHAKKNLELLLNGRLDVTAFCAVVLAENQQAACDACERIREFMGKHPQPREVGSA